MNFNLDKNLADQLEMEWKNMFFWKEFMLQRTYPSYELGHEAVPGAVGPLLAERGVHLVIDAKTVPKCMENID